MSDAPSDITPFEAATAAEDWERVEELWLEALDQSPIPATVLLEVRRQLWKAGKKALAMTLLELLGDTLEAAEDHPAALAALREQVRLTVKPPVELLERLERALAATRDGSPSLGVILERFRLTQARRPAEILDTMECWLDHDCGTVVEVTGQGVGRVIDLNLELENVKVDLGGTRPVSVPFGAVSRYLSVLPAGHFLRRKVEDPEGLRDFVLDDPGEALADLLESLGDESDVAAIKAALEGLLAADAWTSWWNRARKNPRVLSSGSGSRLRYRVSQSAQSATASLLEELSSVGPRERLAVARRLVSRGEEAAAATARFLADSLASLESEDPGLAWETAATLASLPGGKDQATACLDRVLASTPAQVLLTGIQDRTLRADALQALRSAHGDAWVEIWATWLVREDNPANLGLITSELEAAGASSALEGALEAVFRGPLQHPAQFVWACLAMTDDSAPQPLRKRMTPSLLETIPDALSRPEFAAVRGRAKSLLDGGQVAIKLILESASEEQAVRFEKRISRLGGIEPQRVRLVEQAVKQRRSSQPATEAVPLVATRAALEAKRAELKQLLEVEIPKTLKGINAAAAEGDLRENFEYHMLRDRQELQSARAAKLQAELAQVRVLEPGSADTSRVNIGTVVRLADESGSALAPVTILGDWDADLERRIFAAGSELAQGLLGREVDDEVEVEGVTARITAIEPWTG
jgi:transcription elongation factor GreA